jgi:hypothetical protein
MRVSAPVFAALAMAVSSPIGLLGQSPQTTASVAVPRLVSVTGVYQPADGQPPPAGTVVTLLIYADPQGGTPLWQETQNVVLDKDGRYSLLLGAGQADGIPLEVFTSGEAQWLALHFAGVREVEGPRTRITSVPYALRSADADTLGGHPASAYQLTPTSATADGHPAKATSTAADSAQSGSTQPNASTNAVLAGTTNVLAKYVSSTDVGNSAIFESGGLVGINVNQPLDALHVRFTNTGGSLTGLAVQNMGNTATSYSGMLFYDQNGQLGQFQGFNNVTHEYRINNIASSGSINFMLGGSSKFLVASNGNIGIGVVPGLTEKLHVAGDVVVDGNIGAKYQDVAEWVETAVPLEAGTVVIVDPTEANHVLPAPRAYDTRVAGAVSRQPGLVLGERSDGKAMVAQSGRVRVKADATYGAIRIGDLLVTSSTPGYAMRSKPVRVGGTSMHRPGTLLGKALEALPAGKGEILVLLTLQ